MIAQSNFYATGPVEVAGNTLSTNQGNLGTPTNRYSNLYLTGTGYVDEVNTRLVDATTGVIDNLSVNGLWINNTGYTPYNGQYERLITYAEVTGRFVANYLQTNHPINYTTGLVTGLSFPLGANNLYKIKYNLQYSGESNGEGIRFLISGASPVAFLGGNGTIDDFNDSPEKFVINGYEIHDHFHGATDRRSITIDILVKNSSSPVSLGFYASKETAGVSGLAICSGSWAALTQF